MEKNGGRIIFAVLGIIALIVLYGIKISEVNSTKQNFGGQQDVYLNQQKKKENDERLLKKLRCNAHMEVSINYSNLNDEEKQGEAIEQLNYWIPRYRTVIDDVLAEAEQQGNSEVVERCKDELEWLEGIEAKIEEEIKMEIESSTTEGHEYVDLGLPSGTLWAACNVGAAKPEEYGDYFAWGETKAKTTYYWENYQHANGSYNKLTKYCNNADYGNNGFTDNLIKLKPADDAALVSWGDEWCMPTREQWEELYQNTTKIWTNLNGVNGALFTAKNNRSLFLPAAGCRFYCDSIVVGEQGQYWSSSLYTDGVYWSESVRMDDPVFAYGFGFTANGFDVDINNRYHGRSIRAVRVAPRK